jgi:hypothetical protein
MNTISKKPVKVSLFADDMILYFKTQKTLPQNSYTPQIASAM